MRSEDDAMQMPEPGPEHQRLHELAGTWLGEETMHPSPWSAKTEHTEGKVVAAVQLGGFFLISHYQQRAGGRVTFEGHGVYGFDTRQQRYTMHWFDTMGTDPGAPALGTWQDDQLVFVNQSPMDHGRYSYQLIGAGRYRFGMAMSLDGEQWTPLMDALYTRQS